MWKSIIYKEWIKTRSIIAVIVCVFLGVGIYSFISINQNIRLVGIVGVWEDTIQKDPVIFGYFQYLPLFAGILLAIAQYIPELQSKRLKLTLHLPLNENGIMMTMLLYGIIVIALLLIVTIPVLLLGLSRSYPSEIVFSALHQLVPWFFAGLAAYTITAWVCLDPQWKQRIFNIIPGLFFLSFFLLSAKSRAFCPFMPFLIVAIIVSFFFSFYSTARFKEGVQ